MPLESYYDDKWFKNRLKKITEDTEFTEEFSTQVEFLIDCYLSDILTDVADLAERGGDVWSWVYIHVPARIEWQLNARFCPPIPENTAPSGSIARTAQSSSSPSKERGRPIGNSIWTTLSAKPRTIRPDPGSQGLSITDRFLKTTEH